MSSHNIKQPILSIITVAFNAEHEIEMTLASVRKLEFKDYEYIVIDGKSTDHTNVLVSRYADIVSKHIIELDRGIYDAMNKGVAVSSSDWLLFMNAGDQFASTAALNGIEFYSNSVDVFYSDTILKFEDGSVGYERADIKKHRFNHQSFIYRKSLHQLHGNYLCRKGVTIADYLFLAPLWTEVNSRKVDKPISLFKCGGISSRDEHFYQKVAVDIIYGFTRPESAAIKILVYPLYKLMRKFIESLKKRSHESTSK
jgi:glycosyltransferase involved in cell wall biosynthesis